MRILIGWDDPAEAELISLYLNSDDSEAAVTTSSADLLRQADGGGTWDIVLMATRLPDFEGALAAFEEIRERHPERPVVAACPTDDVFRMAAFLTRGLRNYVVRDLGGDFVFLLRQTLESTVQAVQAERAQRIAARLRSEIDAVRRFQNTIIPRVPFSPAGYRVAGAYEPAQLCETGGEPVLLAGGDYFDVVPLDRKHVMFVVADAAGHGMTACMSVMMVYTLIHAVANRRFWQPSRFVADLNRLYCDQNARSHSGQLVTLLYGLLRVDKHRFTWASAGHAPPLLDDRMHERMAPVGTVDQLGLPLGVDRDRSFPSFECTLPPRSRLLLYTDGLVEAHPAENVQRQFGLAGVMNSMHRLQDRSPQAVVDELLRASHAFTEGAGRHDDTTALLIERLA